MQQLDDACRGRLHEIFEAWAQHAPERVAVSHAAECLSYGELNARAERLARSLRYRGVGPDAMVGLCVERGVDMIVGLLGILKAGGAYVPIDPDYPRPRCEFILADCGAAIVVATRAVAECLQGWHGRIVWIDAKPGSELLESHAGATRSEGDDGDLAYVIYTSGSTGYPKGVAIEHRSVIRLFQETERWFRFDSNDVWAQFHSISFDFSVWEIWGALLYGGRLVIVSSEDRSPQRLRTLLGEQRVTILNQTPTVFQQLFIAELARWDPRSLQIRTIVFGGEVLDLRRLKPWIDRYGDDRPALVNMYGITETTVHLTYKRIGASDLPIPEQSPIGAEIPDSQIWLLDPDGSPVSPGESGEIYVSGPGLARGYVNNDALTAERFVVKPYGPLNGLRLYRSGDRAVRTALGELVYLGRVDEQLQVRGCRVEPAEVEHCLERHPLVARAVVAAHDYGDGDVRLIAFLAPIQRALLSDPARTDLERHASEMVAAELPGYMRPSIYRVISEFPVTPHGKLDRRALVARDGHPAAADYQQSAPIEFVVRCICEDVLETADIGMAQDLFDAGATSLTIVRTIREINSHFEVALDGSELSEAATIERLAAAVRLKVRDRRAGIGGAR